MGSEGFDYDEDCEPLKLIMIFNISKTLFIIYIEDFLFLLLWMHFDFDRSFKSEFVVRISLLADLL